MGIDFTTETERKRCKQVDKVDDLVYEIRDAIGCGIDTRMVTNRLKKLRNYLNKEFPLKPAKDPEKERMLDAIIRINNWCCLDLAENAFTSETSGNYLKTLNGICSICQPFVKQRIEKDEEIRAVRNENG